jgi:hypothetical protein
MKLYSAPRQDVPCPCCSGSGYHGSKLYADECGVCEGKGKVDPVYLEDLRGHDSPCRHGTR